MNADMSKFSKTYAKLSQISHENIMQCIHAARKTILTDIKS